MRWLNHMLLLALLAAGGGMLWWAHGALGAPYVTNDGYQYLDAAAHIASGQCACADLAHFDEQLEYGRMPVPFTHFPPGYPGLIAVLMKTGMAPETAGYVISAAGFLGSLFLLWYIALKLGADPWVTAAFSLLWIGHAAALTVASNVGTDSIFTAVLMLLASCMVRDMSLSANRQPSQQQSWTLLFIGTAAGSAYWLRQAGLFLIPVAVAYLAWRWWQTKQVRAWAAAGIGSALLLMGSLQARNIIYTGSWRGGFNSGSHHSLRFVIVETGKAFYHLVFGDRVVARLDPWAGLFAISCLALVWFSFQAFRRDRFPNKSLPALFWLGFLVAVFAGGVAAAALVSIAADFTRYYLPIYPLLLAVGSAAFCWIPRTGMRWVALAGLLGAVLAIHSRSLQITLPEPPYVAVRRALDVEVAPNGRLLPWLASHVGPGESVLAVQGQAVQYVLHRPVVSLIEPEFSGLKADEADLHLQMNKFRSRYMILFPAMPPLRVEEQSANPFVQALANGGEPPQWLKPVLRTADVALLECSSCVQ